MQIDRKSIQNDNKIRQGLILECCSRKKVKNMNSAKENHCRNLAQPASQNVGCYENVKWRGMTAVIKNGIIV